MPSQNVTIYYFVGYLTGSTPNVSFVPIINEFGNYSLNNESSHFTFEFTELPFGDLDNLITQVVTDMGVSKFNDGTGMKAGNLEFVISPTNIKCSVFGAENTSGTDYPLEVDGVWLTLKHYVYA